MKQDGWRVFAPKTQKAITMPSTSYDLLNEIRRDMVKKHLNGRWEDVVAHLYKLYREKKEQK